MPRKIELTFQKGTGSRAGRWKKTFKGKTHYLGSGSSRSDLQSYKSALEKWKAVKSELIAEDAERPNPVDQEYEKMIDEWEHILSWSIEHGDENYAAEARSRITNLKSRQLERAPKAPGFSDRIESLFEPEAAVLKEIADIAVQKSSDDLESLKNAFQNSNIRFNQSTPESRREIFEDDRAIHTQKQVWRDRIENQRDKVASNNDSTLRGWFKKYFKLRKQLVDAGKLSAGRLSSEGSEIDYFIAWAGPYTQVSKIVSSMLTEFHSVLLDLVKNDDCSQAYASGRMKSVKRFIKWLWEQDAIEMLPKNIDSTSLQITIDTTSPESFTT